MATMSVHQRTQLRSVVPTSGARAYPRRWLIACTTTAFALCLVSLALAAPQVASAQKKAHAVAVDATMTLAIIGQPATGYEFAGRIVGKPFGTAATVGETVLTNTPTGLITEGRPVVVYA